MLANFLFHFESTIGIVAIFGIGFRLEAELLTDVDDKSTRTGMWHY